MANYLVMAVTDTAAVGLMTDSMKAAFDTGLAGVKADVFSMIGTALPYGIGIAGVFLAIGLGFRFFRSIAN